MCVLCSLVAVEDIINISIFACCYWIYIFSECKLTFNRKNETKPHTVQIWKYNKKMPHCNCLPDYKTNFLLPFHEYPFPK